MRATPIVTPGDSHSTTINRMARFAGPRTALLPAFADSDLPLLQGTLDGGGPELEDLILRHQLGPLWHHHTKAAPFAKARVKAAMVYLRQLAALQAIDDLFTRAGIVYTIIKGAATRELIYAPPALRVSADLDILVAPDQRVEAARVLMASGYKLLIKASNVSHEILLTNDLVGVDLHWDILRPGRTRVPIVDGLLTRRQRHNGLWMLSDSDALFLMLVHGAISKHVAMTGMGLHRVADIALWWQQRPVDWPVLHDRLAATGLKTAAWTTLTWVRMLSPTTFGPLVETAIDSVRPSGPRAAYLQSWLNRDLPARLAHLHAARLLAFSMFLHDRPSDAWCALKGWQAARMTSATDALVFGSLAD